MEAKEIILLRELCGKCEGCSTKPTSIECLCSNPLEKYLHRMNSPMGTEAEAYFRGRKDGLMMLGANKKQIFRAGIKEVVDWILNQSDYDCGHFIFDIDQDKWNAKLREWGIDG